MCHVARSLLMAALKSILVIEGRSSYTLMALEGGLMSFQFVFVCVAAYKPYCGIYGK